MSKPFSKRGLTVLFQGLAAREEAGADAACERPAPRVAEWPPRREATWEPWRRVLSAIARVGL